MIPARPMHIFGPPAPPIDLQSKCGLIASPINIFKGFIEPFTIFNESGDIIRNCETTKMCKSLLQRSRRVTGGVKEEWLKVVGGNNAKNKNFPWQMSLMGPRVCGGTLVTMNVGLICDIRDFEGPIIDSNALVTKWGYCQYHIGDIFSHFSHFFRTLASSPYSV